MVLASSWCDKSGILQAIYIIKQVIQILCILGPSFVVVTGIITFTKATLGTTETKDAVRLLITKIIVCCFICFIPTIVNTVIGLINNGEHEKNFLSCYNNATPSNIDNLKASEKAESAQKREEKEKQKKENAAKAKETDKKNAKEYEEYNQNNPEEKEDSSSSNSSGSSSSSSGSSSGDIGTVQNSGINGVVYIGDSRTEGMHLTVYGSANALNVTHGNEVWIAKGSMGYNWFTGTAIPTLKNYLNRGNYTVTIQMGTNDLYNSGLANSYVQAITNLAVTYPNSNFVIISVNPINDATASSHGYTATNNQVIAFNNKYRQAISSSSAKNISYCDVYSKIVNNFSSSDGIHYNGTTYKTIYNAIGSCI